MIFIYYCCFALDFFLFLIALVFSVIFFTIKFPKILPKKNAEFYCDAEKRREIKNCAFRIKDLFLSYKGWDNSKEEVLREAEKLMHYSFYSGNNKAHRIFTELNHSIITLIYLKDKGYREGHQEIKDAKEVFEVRVNRLLKLLKHVPF